jgi:molybdate transport system regulatory protein
LVNRSTGGRNGGDTELTTFARRLIAFYRALEQESQLALERLTSNLAQNGVANAADFRQVLRRMSMKTSARNRFSDTVTHIHHGPVNAEVTIALPGGQHVITAVITDDSVKRLELVVGQPLTAVFKASSVFLASARTR